MRIGRVVGNMVSVIHDPCHDGHKFLLVRFLDDEGHELEEGVFADSADAGIGDLVLVSEDGGAAELIFKLENQVCVFDGLILGVIDE
ncbi:MAG: ethanolamine utilization protein EutN [Lachnospiraceae bacterium]|nr:ethanolamine utilization protein EutN [Lachnospiraceae bacterium]